MIGKSVAHYEITAKLGQGGMGEVFRARDTRLDRDVALKFLPLELEQDETARLRFIREAKAAAAIDHPYICSIYEVGQTDEGADYIVMEYVAGQTLQEKLEDGPLPLEKALPILVEGAEAIEKAHSAGFIHRDLKPANLMLTPEGHVKVMDFGLAKRFLKDEEVEQAITTGLTQKGSTLGTLAYMSPEQLKGEELDARSDLFSFGVIVYEVLTGVNPFRREKPMQTAAAILNDAAPPLGRYLADVPYRLELIVSKLLAKDTNRRYQLIHEVKTDLEDLESRADDLVSIQEQDSTPASQRTLLIAWIVALLASGAFLLSLWIPWEGDSDTGTQLPRRLNVEVGPAVKLVVDAGTGPAAVLSPDGSLLAFVGQSEETDEQQIYLRRLDQLDATLLAGTEGARHPVFSPDGRWIGFRADNRLKKVSISGGAAVTLCETRLTRGMDWAKEGWIVFAGYGNSGLFRVSSEGGTPEPLTELEAGETHHRWPQVLPGNETILFTAETDAGLEDTRIVAQRIGSRERKVIWRGGYFGRYLSSGHLLYAYDSTLFAIAFDPKTLEVRGQPVRVVENLSTNTSNSKAEVAISADGTLLYLPGTTWGRWNLHGIDADGHRMPLLAESDFVGRFRFSPDGRRLAVSMMRDGRQQDIWIYEWERDSLTRLSHGDQEDLFPVWSPGGDMVAYIAGLPGLRGIYWKRADGTGEARQLTEVGNTLGAWHPSGDYLALGERRPETGWDILVLPLAGDASDLKAGESVDLVKTPYDEGWPRFSPDGKWLAYTSNESGQVEVYVQPFPGPGARRLVSRGGGRLPVWSSSGAELFYEWDAQIFTVSYRVEGGSFVADLPKPWADRLTTLQAGTVLNYDVHPDGQRLAVRLPAQEDTVQDLSRVVFFQNFVDYLKVKVPID